MNHQTSKISFGHRVLSFTMALLLLCSSFGTAAYAEETLLAATPETAVTDIAPQEPEAAQDPALLAPSEEEQEPEDEPEQQAKEVALLDIVLGGKLAFTMTNLNGTPIDEEHPIQVGDTVYLRLSYTIANIQKQTLDGDTVIVYTFPKGVEIPEQTRWTPFFDSKNSQVLAGERQVVTLEDGSKQLRFKLNEDFLRANDDIEGFFRWNCELIEVENPDGGETKIDFGGDNNEITLYYDSNITGSKDYAKDDNGKPVLDENDLVTFTTTLTLDKFSYDVKISDTLGAAFAFPTPLVFTMTGPDGESSDIAMTVDGQTATADLGNLKAGSYTFTYKASLLAIDGDQDARTNTFRWQWNGNKTDVTTTIVTTGGSLALPLHFEGGKTLVGGTLAQGQFRFALVDADDKKLTEVSNGADGSYGLDYTLTLEPGEAGSVTTSYYYLQEINTNAAGIAYDTNRYQVEVTVTTDRVGGMSAATKITDLSTKQPVDAKALNFTNTKTDAALEIPGIKTLNGGKPGAERFDFALFDADGNQIGDAVQNDDDGNFTLPLTFTEAGEFRYTVKEIKPEDADPNITYDAAEYTVTVKVEQAADGTLKPSYTVSPNANGAGILFNNQKRTGTLTLTGTKTLTNKALTDNEFTFEIVDEAGKVVAEAKNQADGSIDFTGLVFTETGTYRYTLREKAGSTAGIVYDTTVYDLTVTVTEDVSGGLIVTPAVSLKGSSVESFTFANRYIGGKRVSINGVKTFGGQTPSAAGVSGSYRFRMAEWNNASRYWTVTANATSGVFVWNKLVSSGDLKLSGPGEYAYRVFELNDNIPGIRYDTTVYKLVLTADYDANGALVITKQTVYKVGANDGLTEVNGIAFDNTDISTIGTALTATKTLTGDGAKLTADQFSFQLKDKNGNVLQTVKNKADGKVAFDAIRYTAAGTYEYTISEVKGSAVDIEYDKTIYHVTVVVTADAVTGKLTAAAPVYKKGEETATSVSFINEFDADKTPPKSSLEKEVTATHLDGTIDWQSTLDLTDLKTGQTVENLVYSDVIPDVMVNNIAFSSVIDKNSVTVRNAVDGAAVPDYTLTMNEKGNGFQLAFAGKVTACKLIISYSSKTGDLSKLPDYWANLQVKNKAKSSYTFNGNGYEDTDDAVGEFRSLIHKDGRTIGYDPALKAYVISWEIQINLTGFDLGEEEFTLTDTLPEGLSYLEGSAVYKKTNWPEETIGQIEPTVNAASNTLTWKLTTHKKDKFTMTFQTVVGDVLLKQVTNGGLTVKNTVTMSTNGTDIGKDTGEAGLTITEQFAAKSATQVDQVGSNASAVQYTVKINPQALDLLSTNDELTLTDTHSANATLDLNSVRLYVGDSDTLLESGCSIEYSSESRSLTVKVPDGAYYRLCYTLKPTDALYQQTTIKNEAALSGYESWKGSTSDQFVVVEASAGAQGAKGVLTLHKVDAAITGSSATSLPGVKFSLYRVDLNKTKAEGEIVATQIGEGVTGADGKVRFGTAAAPLELDVLFYYVEEQGLPGYIFDREPHYAVLAGNDYNALKAKIAEIPLLADVAIANGSTQEVTVTNTKLAETSARLEAAKYYYGSGDLAAKGFRFTMVSANADGSEKTGDAKAAAATEEKLVDNGTDPIAPQSVTLDNAEGKIVFPAITYRQAGTYYYLLAEDQSAGAAANLNMDPSRYLAAVTVGTDEAGTALEVSEIRYTWLFEDMKEDADEAVFFNNEFVLYSMASTVVTVSGRKTLVAGGQNAAMTAGQFRFDLYGESGEVEATATNEEDGSLAFQLSFARPGVYKFTAREQNGGKTIDGITYDKSECPITITVAKDMSYTVEGEIAFTNTAATRVTVNKVWDDAGHEEQRPAAVEVSLFAKGDTDHPLQTVSLTEENGWAYTFENLPQRDEKGEVIPYTVAETPLAGYRAALTGSADAGYTITNSYDAAANAFYTPQLTKTLTGRDGIPMIAGEFTFTLSDDTGTVLYTAANDAAGVITFPLLAFTEPGSYRYTLAETPGSDAHIVYDDTKITLTVTVTKDAVTGGLTAKADYTDADGSETTEFINSYRRWSSGCARPAATAAASRCPAHATASGWSMTAARMSTSKALFPARTAPCCSRPSCRAHGTTSRRKPLPTDTRWTPTAAISSAWRRKTAALCWCMRAATPTTAPTPPFWWHSPTNPSCWTPTTSATKAPI